MTCLSIRFRAFPAPRHHSIPIARSLQIPGTTAFRLPISPAPSRASVQQSQEISCSRSRRNAVLAVDVCSWQRTRIASAPALAESRLSLVLCGGDAGSRSHCTGPAILPPTSARSRAPHLHSRSQRRFAAEVETRTPPPKPRFAGVAAPPIVCSRARPAFAIQPSPSHCGAVTVAAFGSRARARAGLQLL